MVERTNTELTTFVGTVTVVQKLNGNYGEEYDLNIKPEGIVIKGATGCFHEFLRISKNATEGSIPEGSIIDSYLKELEAIMPEVRKAPTVESALKLMVGKKFTFRKKQLGKAYKGHEASQHWVPVMLA